MTEEPRIHDAKGCPVYPGDVLKVYHFTGANRKRYFMYKIVAEFDGLLYGVCASDVAKKWQNAHKYRLLYVREECFTVVQGYGPGDTVSFEDRPRLKSSKDRVEGLEGGGS